MSVGPGPGALFRELGMRVEDQVQTTPERPLAAPDGPGEGFLEKVGRWNMGPGCGPRSG